MFSEIIDVIDYPKDKVDDIIFDIDIDLDTSVKNQLIKVIKEVYDLNVPPVLDNYLVSII